MASLNLTAFLAMIRAAEGTDRSLNPYAVVFGYGPEITDLSDHPAITGEWRGARLPDAMCINAGYKPGCVSTAAGAYQIIRGTWVSCRNRLGLRDFSPASQDRAATYLIESRGALQDVYAGRIESAVKKCRNEWASLPGNNAKQGQRSMGDLLASYQLNGGNFA
ncbi:glycoside hydrolase family protein [Xylophilus sp. Kf1]|nr:glycoside hydrolase family protein [Xylophilus sp. Kf1]